MDEKFKQLAKLGAGDFDHLDGLLIDHLFGTQSLLNQWQASMVLQDAGLYHAAYGTDGFSENLVSTDQRDKIANIIGKEAEEIVYLYCACDRDYFWPQFANSNNPEFKNRFTGQVSYLSQRQLMEFCELTVANELEIANDNQVFINKYGQSLYKLFNSMQPYLSSYANLSVESVLGGINA
jgi:hypothetical protein